MKTRNDVRVTIRVDKDLKERAEILFDHLGMNMSTALNVFLRKAVDESAIPFSISVSKPGLGFSYSADEVTSAFAEAVQKEMTTHQQKGNPIARYDVEAKKAYLELADGTREYVNG